ncbi:hypothetical protein GRF29_19g2246600 [Pseudopithomyces chartarum]|uniref:Uncharacterized protein n=1 Tax=Pseudopithomyces chartarum TaxID=1892770 RepID=A0AAN6RJU5_9PLEO|nr:hypothetical protein GRF29_19g2246600 [Pseudopithomyces chartarum]
MTPGISHDRSRRILCWNGSKFSTAGKCCSGPAHNIPFPTYDIEISSSDRSYGPTSRMGHETAGRQIPGLMARFAQDTKKGKKYNDDSLARSTTEFLVGLEFGLGLHISQMSNPAKVAAFLSFPRSEVWDPSMILVIVFGIVPSLVENLKKGFNNPPLFNENYELPKKTLADTDWKLIVGAAAFGIGWGLSAFTLSIAL